MINVTNVEVLAPVARFTDPLAFDISFECIGPLRDDLEWNIIYVGSAETDRYDQKLESILVGPIPVGNNKFTFQSGAPDPKLIPARDLLGVTVLLITCLYRGREFVRIGYYVNNEYDTQELRDNPPESADLSRIVRSILADKARVTRFPIEWDETPVEGVPFPAPPPSAAEPVAEGSMSL